MKISNIINEASEHLKCRGCGSHTFNENFECKYCLTHNPVLETIGNKVVDIFDKDMSSKIDDETLIQLFNLSKIWKSPKIFEICSKLNVENILRTKYQEVFSSIEQGSLSNEQCEYLINLMENNIFVKDEEDYTMYFCSILIRNLFYEQNDISLENKLLLVTQFTLSVMKSIHPNVNVAHVKFDDLKPNVMGNSFFNYIRLSKKDVVEALNKKNYIALLQLIFHECAHTFQYYQTRSKDGNYYLNLMIVKEEIIREKFPDYYRENYDKEFSEVDAYYSQMLFTLKYIDIIGIQISDDEKNYLLALSKKFEQRFQDETRTLNGKKTTVSELFDLIEKDVRLINDYPVLGLEYKIENGSFERKTDEELLADYNERIKAATSEDKVLLDCLYGKLIKNGFQR